MEESSVCLLPKCHKNGCCVAHKFLMAYYDGNRCTFKHMKFLSTYCNINRENNLNPTFSFLWGLKRPTKKKKKKNLRH